MRAHRLGRANLTRTLAAVTALGLASWLVPAAAQASAALAWSAPSSIDTQPLVDVACPSSSLCVAVDGSGNLLTTSTPAGGGSTWSAPLAVDPGHALRGIACPSATLCVAVDNVGNVLASTNPTGGLGAWSSAAVAEDGLQGVTCISPTLCLVVGGDGVFSATNPSGGASSWTATHALAGTTGFHTLACASASLCVAGDSFGDLVATTTPLGENSAWINVAGGSEVTSYDGAACPSTTLCVVAENLGHLLISTTPTAPESWERISPVGSFTDVSCPTITFCVAADDFGQVVTSTNPTGGVAAWTVLNVEGPSNFTPIPSITCPVTTLCVAVDAQGNVLTGTAAAEEKEPSPEPKEEPATAGGGGGTSISPGSGPVIDVVGPPHNTAGMRAAQIMALLKQQLVPSGKTSKIGTLLKHGGVSLAVQGLGAGILTVQWYVVPAGAKLAGQSKAKSVLVASGKLTLAAAGAGRLKLQLTAAGRRVMRHNRRLKVMARGVFAPSNGVVVTTTGAVVLRR